MSNGTNGHATLDGARAKSPTLEQLQEEMTVLLKELSTVQDMTPSERQLLQVRFELKSLEIKAQIIQAEHDDVIGELPSIRIEVDRANADVKAAQDNYREVLNRFNALDDRRKRLAGEVDQIQRDCGAIRLRIPS
jgi:chromosome segregation ATPase